MNDKQTTSLKEYVKENAESIIEYLIKLLENQENVKISYNLKKIEN